MTNLLEIQDRLLIQDFPGMEHRSGTVAPDGLIEIAVFRPDRDVSLAVD